MTIDFIIAEKGTGSSKKLRHDAMWVVKRKGFMLSNTVTSKLPIMVNKIMMAIVETIGPIEFSANADNAMESVETVKSAKNATQNPSPKRHKISASCKMTRPSLLSRIKSPVPKICRETNNAKKPSHNVKNKVYIAPAMNFDKTICVREIGFVANMRIVPIAASPEMRSPVTSATNKGMWTINICKMMKAIKLPFKTAPLKVRVCSKEEVTNEIIDRPSAFIAKMMIPTSKVKAPIPK